MEDPNAVKASTRQSGATDTCEEIKKAADTTVGTEANRHSGNSDPNSQPATSPESYWLTQQAWSTWVLFQSLGSDASTALSTAITSTNTTIATTGTKFFSSVATLVTSPWTLLAGVSKAAEPKSLLAPIFEDLKTKSWQTVINKTHPLIGQSFSCNYAIELKVDVSTGKLVDVIFKYAIDKLYGQNPKYMCFFCVPENSLIIYFDAVTEGDEPTEDLVGFCNELTTQINQAITKLSHQWMRIGSKEELLSKVKRNAKLRGDCVPPLLNLEPGKQILHWDCEIEGLEKSILLEFFKKLKAEGRLENTTAAYTFSTLPRGIYVVGKDNYDFKEIIKVMQARLSIPNCPEVVQHKTLAPMYQGQTKMGDLGSGTKEADYKRREGDDLTQDKSRSSPR